MTRRENSRRRRPPRRESRPLVLVVCGAECTERQYLAGLRDNSGSRAVDMVIKQQAKAPVQVVGYASNFAERSVEDFDEVWCVVDVDEFDMDPAIRAARQDGVKLAVSNPCFELWLLLHHEDCRRTLPQCADVHRILKKYVSCHDKTRPDFAHFKDGVARAVERAKVLDPEGTRHERNPSTNVWRLIEKMME